MSEETRGAVPPSIRNSNTFRRGAPKGNRNALKHGVHTSEAKRRRAEARMLLEAVNAALALFAKHSDEITPPRRSSRVEREDQG